MTHQEILRALSGLLMAMFVAMLSSTIVSNALPVIVNHLHGSQTGYTWVVVATLLTMTATTPIWGKLADLIDQKVLVQAALVIFSLGSVMAGLSPNMETLIAARTVQGVGVGGLTALVQVVIASMVSPRERGRYAGYIGATFGLATLSGPLLGGLIVDTPFLGWRWCFFAGIPVAAVAFVVLQKTLHLPRVRRDVSIDYLGAFTIMAGVSLLLIWISLGGNDAYFAWASATSYAMVGGALALIALAVFVEARVAKDPIIPLRLFADRTITLSTLASVMVGVAMFGATVYMSLYFQTAKGLSPTQAGLMSTFMVVGMMGSTTVTGRIITNTGRWKKFLVGGMVAVIVGLALLSRIDDTTSLWVTGAFMFVLGVGLGATMQNLVLAVQNVAAPQDLGSASSIVNFFRSIGGSAGVAVFGAVLAHQVAANVKEGISRLPAAVQQQLATDGSGGGHNAGAMPDLATLPEPIRVIFEHAFGLAIGHGFLVALPFAVVALICVALIKETPLRTSMLTSRELSPEVAAEIGLDQPGGYRDDSHQAVAQR